MNLDLDKAELMLEEYYEKISEQERLIVKLGEQYKQEVTAKENLLAQKNKRDFASYFRKQPGEDDFTMSQLSNN